MGRVPAEARHMESAVILSEAKNLSEWQRRDPFAKLRAGSSLRSG
jgi:hypothetical protein